MNQILKYCSTILLALFLTACGSTKNISDDAQIRSYRGSNFDMNLEVQITKSENYCSQTMVVRREIGAMPHYFIPRKTTFTDLHCNDGRISDRVYLMIPYEAKYVDWNAFINDIHTLYRRTVPMKYNEW